MVVEAKKKSGAVATVRPPTRSFSFSLKDGWKKFTNSRDAVYSRAKMAAAAVPSSRL